MSGLLRSAESVPFRDFFLEVSKGHIRGHSHFHRFGLNEAIGNSFEDVWTASADMVYLETASTITVTSNNGADDIAGTGAQKVTLLMLDSAFNAFSEEVEMDGSGTVVTERTALRVLRVYVSQFGSGRANVAAIDITATTGGGVQAHIPLGENQTLMSHFTVPAGMTGYIVTMVGSVGKNDDAQIKLMQRDATQTNGGFRVARRVPVYQAPFQRELRLPIPIQEKTDVKAQAKAIVAGIQAGISYDMILVKGKYEAGEDILAL